MRGTRALTIFLAVATIISAHRVSAETMAYWEFNDRDPGQSAWNGLRLADSSGDRDAFFSQTTTFVAGAPDHGNTSALRLTSGSDQIAFRDGYAAWLNEDGTPAGGPTAGADINFDQEDSFTIEAVINTSQTAGGGMIASKDNSGHNEWWWRINGGMLEAMTRGDGSALGKVTGSTSVADGQWHHVAFVRDAVNDQLRVYVDYLLDQTAADDSTGALANNVDIRIGRTNSGSNDLVADLDFVRISSGALAPCEFIQEIPEPSTFVLLGMLSLLPIALRRK